MLGIKRTKLEISKRKWIVLNTVQALTALFNVVGLGYYKVEWYENLLFSEWMDN